MLFHLLRPSCLDGDDLVAICIHETNSPLLGLDENGNELEFQLLVTYSLRNMAPVHTVARCRAGEFCRFTFSPNGRRVCIIYNDSVIVLPLFDDEGQPMVRRSLLFFIFFYF